MPGLALHTSSTLSENIGNNFSKNQLLFFGGGDNLFC
jgi:hypothetical protein